MVTFDYLLPKTKEVLIELSRAKDMQDYTFVGGSALSCYLQHRLSEDLEVNTLFLRAKYRDYYDLYCIVNQKYTIYDLFTISSSLLPGLSRRLFQVALTYTDDIIDDNIKHLSPAHSVSKKEIESYFLKKIKEWNKL